MQKFFKGFIINGFYLFLSLNIYWNRYIIIKMALVAGVVAGVLGVVGVGILAISLSESNT